MTDDTKPKITVTEIDSVTTLPLGEPLDTAFKGGFNKGEMVLTGIGQYSGRSVRPTGVNVIITDLSWRPGSTIQSESRLNRKPPPKPKIIRNGRYYTMADLDCTDLPRCFKFKNRRTAMKFFSKGPLIMKSSKQFSSVFGKSIATKTQEVKTTKQALALYGNIEKPFQPLSLANDSPYFKTQANIELMAQMNISPDYLDLEGGTPFANKMAQANADLNIDLEGTPSKTGLKNLVDLLRVTPPIDELLKHGEFEVGDHFGTPFVNLVAKKDKPS